MMAMPLALTQATQPTDSPQPRHVNARNILILAIDDVTRPDMRLLFQAFIDTVSSASNTPAVYFEPLDASRFQERQYLEDLRDWLRSKYRHRRIDLVVPVGKEALGFLADMHVEPWSTARVLYFETEDVNVDPRRTLPQAGGMLLDDHFPAAVDVVKTILPNTRRVALVYGALARERSQWAGCAEKVRRAGLEPIELVGTSIAEILVAVARLPAGVVAVVLGPIVDPTGHVLSPTQICERIASIGNVPTITLEASNLGCGPVGGLMRDWSVIGRLLGDEALFRLNTASTDIVTVPVAKYTTLAFDGRQLQRWGIRERRLPAGAAIRFRAPNLWRDYRGLMLTALGVTLVQSLLIVGVVFERRRRRQAEIESRRNLAAMTHLDRRAAMGELATSLAHELNQPLNAILQNAGVAQMLLASNTLPPALGEMPEIISDIRKDDIRASEVIRRMRGLLQKHEPASDPVDLNEVTHETVAIVRPDARSREIQLEMELASGLGPILGDRIHLQQVLLNLLMNAVDAVAAMPAERRRVRVCTTQSDGEARLAVSDTGTGIQAERLSEIFEPFYTTKSVGNGMGLGLAIARSIVEAHGGRMVAENNAGGGATVWFSVPLPAGAPV
jgi:signal transduction histidine kinase